MDKYIIVNRQYNSEIKDIGASGTSYSVNRPEYCPICTLPQSGKRNNSVSFSPQYTFVLYTCNSCGQTYVVWYGREENDTVYYCKSFIPPITANFTDEILFNISPTFIDIYNQALTSELAGYYELAAIGYRTAMEFLIKDYAVNELGVARKDVEGLSLFNAIKKYLNDNQLKVADVVRILGNDYVHYERKYPQHSFNILKKYLGHFMDMMSLQYSASHPPVVRKDLSQQEDFPLSPSTE